MLEEGRSLYHESGDGYFLVIKEWLDVVIQYGVIAMDAMYPYRNWAILPVLIELLKHRLLPMLWKKTVAVEYFHPPARNVPSVNN